jgi:hypothetical protein
MLSISSEKYQTNKRCSRRRSRNSSNDLIDSHTITKQFFSRRVTREKEVKSEVKGLPQTLLALAEIHPQAPLPAQAANSWTSRGRLSLDIWEPHATGLLERHTNTT